MKYVKFPLITGYMFFGVLVGPQVLEMVSKADVGYLQPITQFALAFISLSAGAELYLPELRALFRRIITITMAVTVICFLICLFVIWGLAAGGLIPFMDELSGSCQFSISLIAASIMVTQSPASAIAVVAETKSKGPFTSTMLGITVLTDIVVLLLYSICAAVANANCAPTADGFKILDLALTVGCVLMAAGIGYVFGKLIIFIIWIPRVQGEWAVLPLGFGIFKISSWFTEYSTDEWGHGINFDPLLICIFAGYVVANHSRNRRKFLRFLGKCGPIIFIPFFTLTGAGLNLKVMGQSAAFAFIVFAVRALTFLGGTALGGHYTGMEKLHLKTLWVSMLTQAGVSLGIAAEVAIAFPEWGTEFQSTIVSVILINQVVGPVLCKWALRKNGEDGQALGDDEDEHEAHVKRCVFIGINISSLAVAQRLLKQDWNVLFIDSDESKVDMLQWLQYERRKKKEKTPAQLARQRELQQAKAAAAAASTFVDLNPPADTPLEQEASQTSEYAPVSEEEMLPAAGTVDSDSPHEASVSSAPPGPEATVESINNTSTLPDDKQVQFRLLKPVADISPKDPISKMRYASEAAGFKEISWDLNSHNVEAAVVMLESDELNFDLCTVLQDYLQLKRVIVEIQNPNWTSMFASIGVLTIFPYSLSSHTMYQMVTCGPHQHLELVSPTRPLHVSLSHIIKPDTLLDPPPPLYLKNLSHEDQAKFFEQHPDPPMPRAQMWKFDEKLRVVPAAQRDEYIAQIHQLHANNQIKLDLTSGASKATATFSGPGMLTLTGGSDAADPTDPDEIAFQETKRQQKLERQRAKEAQRKQSIQMEIEEAAL